MHEVVKAPRALLATPHQTEHSAGVLRVVTVARSRNLTQILYFTEPKHGLTAMSITDDNFEITICSRCGKVVCLVPSSDERYRDNLMARWDIWNDGNPQQFNVNHEVVEGRAGERHVCGEPISSES